MPLGQNRKWTVEAFKHLPSPLLHCRQPIRQLILRRESHPHKITSGLTELLGSRWALQPSTKNTAKPSPYENQLSKRVCYTAWLTLVGTADPAKQVIWVGEELSPYKDQQLWGLCSITWHRPAVTGDSPRGRALSPWGSAVSTCQQQSREDS